MTAKQLIEELQKMPPDAEVWHVWDGQPRSTIEYVWLDNEGDIITADEGERCYSCFPDENSELFKAGRFCDCGTGGVWYSPTKSS
jgi:hypothetical protein